MSKRFLAATVMLLSFGLANTALAATPLMCGRIAHEQVEKLTSEIQWYHNLHKAEAEAQKEGKLIFWMHMLGHIDGAT